jgi:type I restriction-modification system DNA methylase subunit
MAKATNNLPAPRASRQAGGANLGFESDLWRAADALRSNMDAAEYKHVVLGLIFLKYISDAFEEKHAQLAAERAKGPTRRTLTSTEPSTSSGCPKRRAGLI